MARIIHLTLFALLAALHLVKSQPHAHGHAHLHKKDIRARDTVEKHVAVVVVECWLGNHAISDAECQEGIANGTLQWAADGSLASSASAPSTIAAYASSPPASSAPAAPAAPAASNVPATGAGGNVDFPDGQIACDQFPAEYGAVALDWLGLGGWASAQQPGTTSSAGFDDIIEVTSAQCENGNGCIEGSYCSYACPAGQLKYQWPPTQGATGQSIGGLLCKGGKLYKTNPDVSYLCDTGATQVNIFVQNKLGQNVAVCQTNYPGDEKMSIPTDAQPGTTKELACPNGATYYQWEGKQTSAQYYINMPGYSIEKSCVWGSPGDDFGNWAPMNAGVGWSNGAAWLSIFPNLPTQPNARIPFTVEIKGDTLSDTCRYQNGQYCSGANYGTCSPNGCTVSASSGNVYFVFS